MPTTRMRMAMMVAAVVLQSLAVVPGQAGGTDDIVRQLRELAAKRNMTCILVFGDSSVDPGNNNYISTVARSNFPPYGKDFFDSSSTGRFTNGRLATDFIAEALGYKNIIRGFLEPNLETVDLLHGVSFASAGTGYDDLTANLSNVLSVSKQMDYLMHYKIHLRQLVGEIEAGEIIKNALFLLSFGTNDFVQNYLIEPTRAKQFTVEQYQNYLISRLSHAIEVMHHLGARRLVVVGVPPLGCFPLIEMMRDYVNKCDGPLNKVAISFNSKIKEKLATLDPSLEIKTAYVDIYTVIENAVQNPTKYGFTETSKGCCGTGTIEYGETCKGLNTCADPTKYVYWDAVHPTESMYKIIADEALTAIIVDKIFD